MTHKIEDDKPDLSRRKFGQSALAGMAAVLATGRAPAAQNSQHQEPSSQQSSETSPATITSKENEEVEARYQRVMQLYGDRLSAEQKTRIRKILAYNERLLEPIRSFALENGDAPATGLKLYPEALIGKPKRDDLD